MSEERKGHSVTMTAHGDGTYHTVEHGEGDEMNPGMYSGMKREEHASFGHALMHMAKMHGPEGTHMHIHGDEDGYTSHHVAETGKVQGPDEHSSMSKLKAHVQDCMEEE